MRRTLAAMLVRICSVAAGQELPQVPEMWLFATDEDDVGREQEWFSSDFDDSHWTRIPIGQGREKAGFEYDGVAWYRVWMALPQVPEGKRLPRVALASRR